MRQNRVTYKEFKSCSGDWFWVPIKSYRADTAAYKEAIKTNDEKTMLFYEDGETGWIFIEPEKIDIKVV